MQAKPDATLQTTLPDLQRTDKAVPALWDSRFQVLLNNDSALLRHLKDLESRVKTLEAAPAPAPAPETTAPTTGTARRISLTVPNYGSAYLSPAVTESHREVAVLRVEGYSGLITYSVADVPPGIKVVGLDGVTVNCTAPTAEALAMARESEKHMAEAANQPYDPALVQLLDLNTLTRFTVTTEPGFVLKDMEVAFRILAHDEAGNTAEWRLPVKIEAPTQPAPEPTPTEPAEGVATASINVTTDAEPGSGTALSYGETHFQLYPRTTVGKITEILFTAGDGSAATQVPLSSGFIRHKYEYPAPGQSKTYTASFLLRQSQGPDATYTATVTITTPAELMGSDGPIAPTAQQLCNDQQLRFCLDRTHQKDGEWVLLQSGYVLSYLRGLDITQTIDWGDGTPPLVLEKEWYTSQFHQYVSYTDAQGETQGGYTGGQYTHAITQDSTATLTLTDKYGRTVKRQMVLKAYDALGN